MKFGIALIAVASVAQASDRFRSGSVSTHEKFTFGKFVTRMKAPNKKGTVSSFFTYFDAPEGHDDWNELDIEVVPSVEHNPFSTNIIFGGDGFDKTESHQYVHEFNPKDEWHTYTLEWTPDYISWSIDGHEVRHVDDQDVIGHIGKDQSLRMNFWTPEFHVWGQGLDSSDMPWYLMYDYVQVFTYDEADNEFHEHWKDNFDTFDSTRWHKASGGFDSNSSIFHPENVSVKAGNLVLKMEPEASYHHEQPVHHRHYHHQYETAVEHANYEDDEGSAAASDHDDDFGYHRYLDSSDSEAEWNEYQRHFADEQHDDDSGSHQFWVQKKAYKEWKLERKLAYLKDHDDVRHDEEYYVSHDLEDMEPLPEESYLEYKQRKYERKMDHKRAKRHSKELKSLHKHHHRHDDRDYEYRHHGHHSIQDHHDYRDYNQHYDQDYESDYSGDEREQHYQLYEAPEQDFRHYKYDQDLFQKQRDVDEKQRDADEKFTEFRTRHPYMSEEELELHHHHYEVEPFFYSHAEKKAWKLQKKEEKALREERRRILKHEREAREIEEAYQRIMDPEYVGDEDVDHVIEERRRRAAAADHERHYQAYEEEEPYHRRHVAYESEHSDEDYKPDSDSDQEVLDYEEFLAWRRARKSKQAKTIAKIQDKKPAVDKEQSEEEVVQKPKKQPEAKRVRETEQTKEQHYGMVPKPQPKKHEAMKEVQFEDEDNEEDYSYGQAPIHHRPAMHYEPTHHAAIPIHTVEREHRPQPHYEAPHRTPVHVPHDPPRHVAYHQPQIHHESAPVTHHEVSAPVVHHATSKRDHELIASHGAPQAHVDSYPQMPIPQQHHSVSHRVIESQHHDAPEHVVKQHQTQHHETIVPAFDHKVTFQVHDEPHHLVKAKETTSTTDIEQESDGSILAYDSAYHPRHHDRHMTYSEYAHHGGGDYDQDSKHYEEYYRRPEYHQYERDEDDDTWNHDDAYVHHEEVHEALDHAYDDKHDVEPVHYHEHAVHHAFSEDLDGEHVQIEDAILPRYAHGYNEFDHEQTPYEHLHDAEQHLYSHARGFDTLQYIHEYGHHGHRALAEAERDHRVLDHKFDDQHDIEPVHYHEHAIHHNLEDGHRYQEDQYFLH